MAQAYGNVEVASFPTVPSSTAENSCDTFGAPAPLFIRKLVRPKYRGELFMRRRPLIVIVPILIVAIFAFTWSISAHNIDLRTAREIARGYARSVRDESGGKYAHYSTTCVRAFPNHNHYVRCQIDYQNATDWEKGVYTCRESIEIFHNAHDGGISGMGSWILLAKHTSANECGKRRLGQNNDGYTRMN